MVFRMRVIVVLLLGLCLMQSSVTSSVIRQRRQITTGTGTGIGGITGTGSVSLNGGATAQQTAALNTNIQLALNALGNSGVANQVVQSAIQTLANAQSTGQLAASNSFLLQNLGLLTSLTPTQQLQAFLSNVASFNAGTTTGTAAQTLLGYLAGEGSSIANQVLQGRNLLNGIISAAVQNMLVNINTFLQSANGIGSTISDSVRNALSALSTAVNRPSALTTLSNVAASGVSNIPAALSAIVQQLPDLSAQIRTQLQTFLSTLPATAGTITGTATGSFGLGSNTGITGGVTATTNLATLPIEVLTALSSLPINVASLLGTLPANVITSLLSNANTLPLLVGSGLGAGLNGATTAGTNLQALLNQLGATATGGLTGALGTVTNPLAGLTGTATGGIGGTVGTSANNLAAILQQLAGSAAGTATGGLSGTLGATTNPLASLLQQLTGSTSISGTASANNPIQSLIQLITSPIQFGVQAANTGLSIANNLLNPVAYMELIARVGSEAAGFILSLPFQVANAILRVLGIQTNISTSFATQPIGGSLNFRLGQ